MRDEKGTGEEPAQDLYERAFTFACRIVKLHRYLVKHDSTGRELAGQLLRSGTSIGANLEEGRGAQTRPDFITKFAVALKEARETLYWLRLLSASEFVAAERIEPLMSEANELVAILTAIVKKARQQERKREK